MRSQRQESVDFSAQTKYNILVMSEHTRFVLEGDIDSATSAMLQELALERGLRAASFIVPAAMNSEQPEVIPVESAESIADDEIVRANKSDFLLYAKSIGFDYSHAAMTWNWMARIAKHNPFDTPYKFSSIPSDKRGFARYELYMGLDLNSLHTWATNIDQKLVQLSQFSSATLVNEYLKQNLAPSIHKFKLVANFAANQLGEPQPYEPESFTTQSRKQKQLDTEQMITERTAWLKQERVIDDKHELVEPVIVQEKIFSDGKMVEQSPEIELGISYANMVSFYEARSLELGITDVRRIVSYLFGAPDRYRSTKILTRGGSFAYSLDEFFRNVERGGPRHRELLVSILSEVTKDKNDIPA